MKCFQVRELEVCLISPTIHPQREEIPFTTFDLMQKRSSMPYLQRICFFPASNHQQQTDAAIQAMKTSLSQVLNYFYPLAGRLKIDSQGSRPLLSSHGAGVEFSVAEAVDASLDELDYSHPQPWFDQLLQRGRYEYAGLSTTIPFLSVQVTKFKCGGVTVAWSYDHMVIDGSSQWYFMQSWSQILKQDSQGKLSLPPTHDRYFETQHPTFAGITPISNFSFAFEDVSGGMEARVFQFGNEVITRLKSMVPQGGKFGQFSAFEVVASQIWISMSKARHLPASQVSYNQLPVNCRARLRPPLPESYFGNCVLCAVAEARVGDITSNDLGYTADLVQSAIKNFGEEEIRSSVAAYNSDSQGSNPFTVGVSDGVHVYGGSSHRFPMYDIDFGWGKPAAVRHARNLWNGFCFYDPRPGGAAGMEVTVYLPAATMEEFSKLLFAF